MKKSSLKSLETQLTEQDAELKEVLERKKQLSKRESQVRERIAKTKARINMLKKGGIIVSEHAMLRFCERILGLNIDQLKKDCLPEDTKILAEHMRDGTFPAKTHRVVVQNGVVVTIIENKG